MEWYGLGVAGVYLLEIINNQENDSTQGVLKTYAASHTDEEVIDLLFDFCDDIERVRKDYRNPSAHTNALTKISAKECFDLVLDVEKLLKRMLDAFDE